MPQLTAGRRQLPTAPWNISYHGGGLQRSLTCQSRHCHHLALHTPLLCPFLWIITAVIGRGDVVSYIHLGMPRSNLIPCNP